LSTGTYRAIQVSKPGKFELVDRAMTAPPAGKVRIRVEACGVCHTDSITGVMIADEHGLAAIPDESAAADAAPLVCAGVTTFNALRNSPARPGDLAAVQGVGGLGHLGVQFARRMGFRVAAQSYLTCPLARSTAATASRWT